MEATQLAESCAAGTGLAAATDGGNPTAARTDAAAGTSASAYATAPAGMVHFQQQQQESAVEDERVRTPTLRSFCTMSIRMEVLCAMSFSVRVPKGDACKGREFFRFIGARAFLTHGPILRVSLRFVRKGIEICFCSM